MKILEKEDFVNYLALEAKIGCVVFKESLQEISKEEDPSKTEVSKEEAEAVGALVGAKVLAKTVALTENMSKEEVVKYLAQALGLHTIIMMNDDKSFFAKIVVASMQEKD